MNQNKLLAAFAACRQPTGSPRLLSDSLSPDEDLVILNEILAMANSGVLRSDDIRLVQNDREISREEYSLYVLDDNLRSYNLINEDHLSTLFAAGSTIIVPQIHRFIPKIAELAEAVGQQFGSVCRSGLAITPPGTHVPAIHHRPIDQVVHQLRGSKRWRAWDPIAQDGEQVTFFDEALLGPADLDCQLSSGGTVSMPSFTPYVGSFGQNLSVAINFSINSPGQLSSPPQGSWSDGVPLSGRRRSASFMSQILASEDLVTSDLLALGSKCRFRSTDRTEVMVGGNTFRIARGLAKLLPIDIPGGEILVQSLGNSDEQALRVARQLISLGVVRVVSL